MDDEGQGNNTAGEGLDPGGVCGGMNPPPLLITDRLCRAAIALLIQPNSFQVPRHLAQPLGAFRMSSRFVLKEDRIGIKERHRRGPNT